MSWPNWTRKAFGMNNHVPAAPDSDDDRWTNGELVDLGSALVVIGVAVTLVLGLIGYLRLVFP